MDYTPQSSIQSKPRTTAAKGLQVDSEAWFLMIHEYLRALFINPEKQRELKHLSIESLASSLGRNVVERCADDKAGKYREKKDIIRFIAVEVWSFLFGKMITRVDVKEENTYYFFDNDFKFLRRISPDDDVAKEYISFCMNFIGHLLRFAIKSFSYDCVVSGETQNYTDYTFTIQFKAI